MSEEKPEKDYTLVFCFRKVLLSTTPAGAEQSAADASEVMLGWKKRGFGVGKWNGFGGKVEPGESNEDAAKRELCEESGVVAKELTRVGFLKFAMHTKIMNVHVYTCNSFEGECFESDEMRPKWTKVSEIDYDAMWPDDRHWLPVLLSGEKFIGRFAYDEDDEIVEGHDLRIL